MTLLVRRTLLYWCYWSGLFGLAASAQKPELVVQTGHSAVVRSVAFSPDGKTLASGSGDSTIKIWDVASRHELRTLDIRLPESVAFSPDGRTLASGSSENTIKLWDVASGHELRTLAGHTGPVVSVAFSPDGRTLASGSFDTTIKLWDVASGHELRILAGYTNFVESVAFSPDGRTLASGGLDTTIKLWDVASGHELRTLGGHTAGILSVAFSSDGKILASGNDNGTIKLWDVGSGRELRTLSGHTGWVKSVAFSPDGRTLASGSFDTTIKLWDVVLGRAVGIVGVTARVESVAFSPDGRTLAAGSEDKAIKFWDVGSRRMLQLPVLAPHSSWVISVAFSPDGRTLASGSADNRIKLCNMASGRELQALVGHTGSVSSVAFSPDGRTLASGSFDTTIKLWDVASGRELRILAGHTGRVTSVAFSRDGATLASGSVDKTIKLWDLATGRELRTLSGHTDAVESVAFSPDGATLASGSVDKTIKLWDVTSRRELRTLAGHTGWVESVAFNPDGHTLASGSRDKTTRLWDVASGRELRTLAGHTGWVGSVAFNPDGHTLASGSMDKTIGLWDVTKGQLLRSLTGPSGRVGSVSFRSDGRVLASGEDNGAVRFWDAATGEELAARFALDQSDWAVVDPEGRFDTNNLDEIPGLNWVFPDEPLRALPVEIFMRQYYEPRLLPRILAGEKLKPVAALQALNRVQPEVHITGIERSGLDTVVVTVNVSNSQGELTRGGAGIPVRTGVYDLRLFRNGQLVGHRPEGEDDSRVDNDVLDNWRRATRIQVDPGSGKSSIRFENIKLPRRAGPQSVEFSAYAFNEDRVKSLTDRRIFALPKDLSAVKGRAYIITIGVNASESPAWDLKYAANDARRMLGVLYEKLSQVREYEEIVQVPLVSDYRWQEGRRVVTESLATKANLKAILDLLSGNKTDDSRLPGIPNAKKIRVAQPEDLIVISFSGHGYVDSQGAFYFMPYDIGTGTGEQFTDALLNKAISTNELSAWVQHVDAGNLVMIVDACHSAAVVEQGGFKPGPMGSRGLGQLAYDKGMSVLSASQTADVALESEKIRQGLLSYALVEEGLVDLRADLDGDGQILLSEWLTYGRDRVPKLYADIEEGKGVGRGGRQVALVGTPTPAGNKGLQQPALFDFDRNKAGVVLAGERAVGAAAPRSP